MSKTITTTLEKICLQQKGSIISGPFGSNISSKYFVSEGVPVIRGNNLSLSYDKFYDDGFVFVTKEKADELKCYAYRGDLIFTAAGTIGQVGIIPESSLFDEYVISNKQIRARIDTNKVDLLYAYYWFSSSWIQEILRRSNKGSTVPLLTLHEVKELPIIFPESLSEQRKIAKCIESISRKIEINAKINDNLQRQLKLLYDYWFTQFDFQDENGKPYRASGGAMVWNEQLKRTIPTGWSFGQLKDVLIRYTNGLSLSENKDYPYTPIDTLPSYQLSFYQVGNQDDANSSLIKYEKNAILFGAMRPYFHRVCIAPFEGITRTTVFTLKEKYENELGYAYETLNQDYAVNYANAHHVGTQQPYAEWDDNLENCLIPLPPHEIRAKYSNFAQPIIDQALAICLENQQLTALRDWLLPMLMNGQATISD
jgi:type I restriction enzyme S subunit